MGRLGGVLPPKKLLGFCGCDQGLCAAVRLGRSDFRDCDVAMGARHYGLWWWLFCSNFHKLLHPRRLKRPCFPLPGAEGLDEACPLGASGKRIKPVDVHDLDIKVGLIRFEPLVSV